MPKPEPTYCSTCGQTLHDKGLGRKIAAAVKQIIQNEMRAGGMLEQKPKPKRKPRS